MVGARAGIVKLGRPLAGIVMLGGLLVMLVGMVRVLVLDAIVEEIASDDSVLPIMPVLLQTQTEIFEPMSNTHN